MHPLIQNNEELQRLYELNERIGKQILGSTGKDRRDLIRLRRKVQSKIKSIDPWDKVRENLKMKEIEDRIQIEEDDRQ